MPGVVDGLSNGEWQAHLRMRVNGKQMHVRGPRRKPQEKRKAEADLAIIAGAGELVDAPNGDCAVLGAMLNAAKRLKTNSDCSMAVEPGAVDLLHSGEWQAHVQLLLNAKNIHVRGPRREAAQKRKAEMDLSIIAAAGARADASKGKAAVLDAMIDAAKKLKTKFDFEESVSAELSRSFSESQQMQTDTGDAAADDPSEVDSDDPAYEPYDLPADRAGDVDEPWQDIDENGNMPKSEPTVKRVMVKPSNPVEATAALSKFLPAFYTPSDLAMLLDARADPNIFLGKGHLPPLAKVMTFALREHVVEMRDLLLQAGAVNTADMKARWIRRCRVDEDEPIWLRNFHRDPR